MSDSTICPHCQEEIYDPDEDCCHIATIVNLKRDLFSVECGLDSALEQWLEAQTALRKIREIGESIPCDSTHKELMNTICLCHEVAGKALGGLSPGEGRTEQD